MSSPRSLSDDIQRNDIQIAIESNVPENPPETSTPHTQNAPFLFQQLEQKCPNLYAVAECGGDMLEELNTTVNVSSALPFLMQTICAAWPTISPTVNKGNTIFIPPFAVSEILLRIAKKCYDKKEAKNIHNIHDILLNINAGFNNAYFVLVSTIAAYLAIYEAAKHVGDNQVDTSNALYLGAFVLPSLLSGATYFALTQTKEKWSEATTTLAIIAKCTHYTLDALTTSGTLNTLVAMLFAAFGWNEMGAENEYKRLAIFLTAMGATALLAILNRNAHFAKIGPAIINSLATSAYLSSLFSSASREQYTGNEFTILQVTFGILGFVSLCIGLMSHLLIKKDPIERPLTSSKSILFHHDNASRSSAISHERTPLLALN